MKSLKRKVMSMFLILVISLFVGTCISSKVNAATKPLLTEKKISVLKGQKQRIGLLYNSKNAKWSVSNKRIVFCKHFLDKVAKHFWTLLQVQIGQSCKASTGSYPASRIAIADNI